MEFDCFNFEILLNLIIFSQNLFDFKLKFKLISIFNQFKSYQINSQF